MDVLKHFKAYYLVFLTLELHRVQGQVYVSSRCVTSEVYMEEAANVTCYFSTDLHKSSKSFRLYRYDFDSGSTGSQQQDKYVIVLDCFWPNLGNLECDPMPAGYIFNGTVTDQLTVTIPKVSLDYMGRYECRAQPSYPQEIQHCVVVPKVKAQTTTALMTTAISPGVGDSDNAAGVAVGVILAILLVAGITFFLVFRRRVLLWIRRFRRKPRTREENLGETARPLLPSGPSPAINKSITQQPSGSSAVIDERIDNLETVVLEDSGEGADDRSDDTHVKDGTPREEPPLTSDTETGVNENYRATVGPTPGAVGPRTDMAFAHDPESKPVVNARNNENDEIQQGEEVLPLSENNKDKEHCTSAELLEETTPSTTNNAEIIPSPEERGVCEASRRHPAEEEKAAATKASDHTQVKDSSNKPPSDTDRVVDIEGVPNLNWKFYRNEIESRPDGRRIEEIHERWARDLDLLDRHHKYIQWLFPIPEEPTRNSMAQKLFDYEAEAIRFDKETSARFLRSYKIMLNYFGLKLEDTGDVSRADNWNDRCKTLQNNSSNYYRISRILTCLGEMGCEDLKKTFIRRILMEVSNNPDLRAALESCRDYWIPTVKDEKDRTELEGWYSIASA